MPTVTLKGQVTLPKRIRDALNIGPGSLVEFVMNNDGRSCFARLGARVRRFHSSTGLSAALGQA